MEELKNNKVEMRGYKIEITKKPSYANNFMWLFIGGCFVFAGMTFYKRLFKPLSHAVVTGFNEAKEELKRGDSF